MATKTFKKNTAYRVYENGNFTSEVLTVKSSKRVLEDKGGYQVITYHIISLLQMEKPLLLIR